MLINCLSSSSGLHYIFSVPAELVTQSGEKQQKDWGVGGLKENVTELQFHHSILCSSLNINNCSPFYLFTNYAESI